MNNVSDEVKTWAIVELMGHKVVAGLVSKSEMLGKPLLRVDVPATSTYPEFTQFYGEAAIYCVTFVSEEVAKRTAEANKTNPVSVYVPDLITMEQLKNVHNEYQERIKRLQRQLPETVRVDDDDLPGGDEEDDPGF
jgi:ethanolamine utilization protein EutQ (cupin superfamily)